MAHANELIENPVARSRILFLKTARDTNGELLQVEMTIGAFGHGTSTIDHVHPKQEERLTILSGELNFRYDGAERIANIGEVISIPPGVVHYLYNNHPDETRFIVEFRPALDTETFWETTYGLARDGKVGKDGNPNLLQLAVIGQHFKDEGYIVKPPRAVQQVVVPMLARMGKARGYRAVYPQYSGAAAVSRQG